MFNRKNAELVNAIATSEGVDITDDANERVRFEYGDHSEPMQTWEIDLSEKRETEMEGQRHYYIPIYRAHNNEEFVLTRIALVSKGTRIVTGKRLEYRSVMHPQKRYMTESLWEQEKDHIRKRRALIGGSAVGGSAIFAIGLVTGTIGIKKWVEKRR